MADSIQDKSAHQWKFFRAGGFDQVLLENEDDLLSLAELDKKLWSVLSCPVKGVEFDQRTLQMIDSDNDGHIRVPELLAAIGWAGGCLKDKRLLVNGQQGVPLSSIDTASEEGKLVLGAARRVLANLGKADAGQITVEDAADNESMIAQTRFNGDGIITAATPEDESLTAWVADIIACLGGETDRSGEIGINRDLVERFSAEATAWLEWCGETISGVAAQLPLENREEALLLWSAVKPKIEDYFLRCSMAEYDSRAATALNSSDETLAALAPRDLSTAEDDLALLPLAAVTREAVLDLEHGLNPAWSTRIARVRSALIQPLLGDMPSLTAARWCELKRSVEACEEWWGRRVETAVAVLGNERLKTWTGDDVEASLLALIDQDLALQPEFDAAVHVERLTRYCRDLAVLANNYVSFSDFYTGRGKAIFQSGTLYLDGRSFELCISVTDVAKHAVLANLSRVYLVYCDCVRSGGADKLTIAAAITNGDSDQLLVGRNGVFYDRQGLDWDATIVRIIEHPISIRQAFWAPYKRIGKMVGDQLQKLAAARSKAAEDKAAAGLLQAGQKPADAKPVPQQAFDVGKFAGIFAAIGLAVGALGAAIASLLTGLFKLAWWQMPLALMGIMLLISGPSIIIAWFKLRQRNLGRLLDANGWAVNTHARINIPFGASLTGLARLPQGAQRKLSDPFEEKKSPWKSVLFFMVVLAAVLLAWKAGLIPMK